LLVPVLQLLDQVATGDITVKRLKQDFRRMLEGLAHQDAGEYLSVRGKARELGSLRQRGRPGDRGAAGGPATRRRVGLVSDGRAAGGHVDYAIDVCRRQHTGLDILLHGDAAIASGNALDLLERAREQGIETQLVQLRDDNVQALGEYLARRPSLLFLVALAGDVLTRAITESAAIGGQRLHVPLVMIQENAASLQTSMGMA
jgi:hypothetical protein